MNLKGVHVSFPSDPSVVYTSTNTKKLSSLFILTFVSVKSLTKKCYTSK